MWPKSVGRYDRRSALNQRVPRSGVSDSSGAQSANRLLSLLSAEDKALICGALEPVTLPLNGRLQSHKRPIEHIYFIEVGAASVVALGGADRSRAEVAMVGREGMTGVSVLAGLEASPWEVVMQSAGTGKRIHTQAVLQLIAGSASLHRSLLRYVSEFTVQLGHTALAVAHGDVVQRVARRLLMLQDRLGQTELPTTHENLSVMLGVRRAGVTLAVHVLTRDGLITHRRGAITIIARTRLIERAGGFYGAAEAEFSGFFDQDSPRDC